MSSKRLRVHRVEVRHPVSLLDCLSLLARLSPFSLTLCAWLAGGWVWLAASTHSPWAGYEDRAQCSEGRGEAAAHDGTLLVGAMRQV